MPSHTYPTFAYQPPHDLMGAELEVSRPVAESG